MPLNTLSGTLGRKRAAHLLRRACFGASVSQIDAFANLTAAQAFQALLRDDLPQPPLPVDPKTTMEWITTGTTDANSEGFELERYLSGWMIGQMLAAGVDTDKKLSYSFRERLIFFLHTHFTTKKSVVNNTRAIYFQNALFRFFAFDQNDVIIPSEDPENLPDTVIPINFRQLTKKLCVDNAMLVFLDGRLNVKGSPNENFARELLELYSIGKGLEGHVPEPEFDGDYAYFTEQDVQAAARVLSGFNVDDTFSNIDEETGLPRGIPRGGGIIVGSHDNGTKVFSQRFANHEIAPDPELLAGNSPTEESVLDEISQLIDMIYEQEQTAIHICRKIYRFFVYHQITPELENDVIREMADIFAANDFKLIPLLEALFTSEHFYDGAAGYPDDNFGSIIKSPLDLVVGMAKQFEIPVPGYEAALESYYNITTAYLSEIERQGMDFYEPFEVAGYAAYHQFPIFHRNWITPNYLTNRYNYIRSRISNGISIEMGQVDILVFVQDNIPTATARDARSLIIALASYFLPVSEHLSFESPENGELTGERLNFFLNSFLYSPQIDNDPEASWTYRWDNREDTETMANQLVNLINAMLQSPEYQLM